MKYLPLVWSALWRKPMEALLTWSATAAAFTLFGLMVALNLHTRQLIDDSRMDLLFVVMRSPDQPYTGLPLAMADELARVEGVAAVGGIRWVDGRRGEPGEYAGVISVTEGLRKSWPDAPLTPAQWDRLFAAPTGIIVSQKEAQRWALKEGDRFSFKSEPGTRADGGVTWEFEVVGIALDTRLWSDGFMLGNATYVENASAPDLRGRRYSFWVLASDPQQANDVCRRIDRRFANSGTPTYCVPQKTDAVAMANTNVDVATMTSSVAGAGLFMILFLTANAIARSVRERSPEFAVLATIGFQQRHIKWLVFAEAAIPCVAGALLGTGIAALLSRLPGRSIQNDFAYLLSAHSFSPSVLVWALVAALVLAVCSSTLPLMRLRRLSVTDALAGR